MKILVAGWDSGGGVEAVQTVVGRAVARGHQVRVLGSEGLRSRFESAGATFLRYRYAPDNDMSKPETDLITLAVFRSWMPALNRVRAEVGLPPVRGLPAAAQRTAARLAAERDDNLVVDELERLLAGGGVE